MDGSSGKISHSAIVSVDPRSVSTLGMLNLDALTMMV